MVQAVHSNSTLKTKANIFAEGHIFKLTTPVLLRFAGGTALETIKKQ